MTTLDPLRARVAQSLFPLGLGLLAPIALLEACASPDDDTREEAESADGEEARRQFDFELVEGVPMYAVLPPDAIPAIDHPELVSAAGAQAFMKPDEPVLGVVGFAGTAACYSAWLLDSHEIVNDVLDGAPIAATW